MLECERRREGEEEREFSVFSAGEDIFVDFAFCRVMGFLCISVLDW